MIEKFFIKPSRENLIVRDPVTRENLKNIGEHKPKSGYWLRRIADKSVIEIKQKQKKKIKNEY